VCRKKREKKSQTKKEGKKCEKAAQNQFNFFAKKKKKLVS
jgi:hypothetical protein